MILSPKDRIEQLTQTDAEELSEECTASFFAERVSRADLPKTIALLQSAGTGNPPIPGDELLS